MEESRENIVRAPQAAPARKGSGTVYNDLSYTIPYPVSLATRQHREQSRGTCVHPKKRTRKDRYRKKGKKGQKGAKKKKRKEKRHKKLNACPRDSAYAEDGTTRPDGRQERKKRAATQSSKNLTRICMSSWWGKDGTRDPREGRDKGAK